MVTMPTIKYIWCKVKRSDEFKPNPSHSTAQHIAQSVPLIFVIPKFPSIKDNGESQHNEIKTENEVNSSPCTLSSIKRRTIAIIITTL